MPQAQDPMVLIGELVKALNLYSNPGVGNCKVEFNQPFCWLYSVLNLLVFQHLVTLYLDGFVVKVVSEIEC